MVKLIFDNNTGHKLASLFTNIHMLATGNASGSADWIHSVLDKLETQSTFDTQGINGDAIDTRYSLTEGKRLDDGQINL